MYKIFLSGKIKLMSIIKKILRSANRFFYYGLSLPEFCEIIEVKYGHYKSRQLKKSIDKDGKPIPWFTYPAIDYLKQLDLRDKVIFEWGSGNSSRYFSSLSKLVFSVEDNKEWFELISNFNIENHKIVYATGSEYVNAIGTFNLNYDVIVIDCYLGELREECSKKAVNYLKEDGLIILDNSDRHPDIGEFFRNFGFIEVDMHGLGPINDYTWTTSFFFSRKFNFKPLNIQPQVPIGGGF